MTVFSLNKKKKQVSAVPFKADRLSLSPRKLSSLDNHSEEGLPGVHTEPPEMQFRLLLLPLALLLGTKKQYLVPPSLHHPSVIVTEPQPCNCSTSLCSPVHRHCREVRPCLWRYLHNDAFPGLSSGQYLLGTSGLHTTVRSSSHSLLFTTKAACSSRLCLVLF